MRKNRILAGIILCTLVAGIFGNLAPVHADGIIAPPYHHHVYETAQKALIIYEDGVETLVITAVFEGSARDFGWIVPVPNKPEVEKTRVDIFEDLAEMTMPRKNLLDKIMYPEEIDYYQKGSTDSAMWMPAEGGSPRSTIVVHEEKRVGIFDIAVLTAEKVEDLEDWLDENGYELPHPDSKDEVWIQDDDPVYDYNDNYENEDIVIVPEPPSRRRSTGIDRSRAILQDYIDAEWFFVAVKVDNRFIDDANANVAGGRGGTSEISPLRFTFETSDLIYPMRITSLSNSGIDTTIYTLTDEKVWVSNYDSDGDCRDGEYYQSNYDFEKIENNCSDFEMTYGSTVSTGEIEDLTKEVGKGSWYKPERKMYLSKHVSLYLLPEAMTADVLFEEVGGTSGLNDGSMSLLDWIKLPFVFFLYIPRNVLMGIAEGLDGFGGDFGTFAVVALMIGGSFISTIAAFAWHFVLKRTRKRSLRILLYVLQFPAVWLSSRLIGISVAVLLSFVGIAIGIAIGIHEEVAVVDSVLIGDKIALIIALVFYRFQWKAKKVRLAKSKKAAKQQEKRSEVAEKKAVQ